MAEVKSRLRPGEDAAEGLRRVVAERVAFAIARVERPRPDRGLDAHDVRTSAKRLRAWWRLVRPFAGDRLYRRENARLRDAARRLSTARDRDVGLRTLRGFLETDDLDLPSRAAFERALDALEAAAGPDLEPALHAAVPDLRATGAAFAAVPIPSGDREVLREGLEKTRRRARKAARRIQGSDEDTEFHEFRKRLKYYWYQVRLVEAVAPDLARLEPALDRVQELLGDDHDLVALSALLPDTADAPLVREHLARRSRVLRERIRPAARDLFG